MLSPCSALPAKSLSGSIALAQLGTCSVLVKVKNLQAAGALGAIFIEQSNTTSLNEPVGLTGTMIPVVAVFASDGTALRNYLNSNASASVSLDPGLTEVNVSSYNTVASFSSRGPATGFTGIKPDLAAVGTDLYLATESFDPNGELFSPDGYTVSQGTSFSAPMVAGAAALVKQHNPRFSPAQVKSALVNTAASSITDNGSAARVTAVGAGLLDAGAAVTTNVGVSPTSIAFGPLKSGAFRRTSSCRSRTMARERLV